MKEFAAKSKKDLQGGESSNCFYSDIFISISFSLLPPYLSGEEWVRRSPEYFSHSISLSLFLLLSSCQAYALSCGDLQKSLSLSHSYTPSISISISLSGEEWVRRSPEILDDLMKLRTLLEWIFRQFEVLSTGDQNIAQPPPIINVSTYIVD